MKKDINECVQALERLLGEQQTGALFIFVDGTTAYFNLRDGEIIFLFYQSTTGLYGLQKLIAAVNVAERVEFNFNAGPVSVVDEQLPNAEQILAAIVDPDKLASLLPSNDEVPVPSLAAKGGLQLTERGRDVLEQAFVDYYGPMGSVICGDTLGPVTSLRAAIDVLAAYLDDANMRDTFVATVRKRLAALAVTPEKEETELAAGGKPIGAVLDHPTRALLLYCLASNTTRITRLDDCLGIVDRTSSLRVAIDHILDHVPDSREAALFKEDFRRKYKAFKASDTLNAVSAA